jgi:hypothetical protein
MRGGDEVYLLNAEFEAYGLPLLPNLFQIESDENLFP